MTTQSSKMAAGLPVAFGHRYLLERLERRLQDSLNPPDPAQRTLEPALVAGVFGEWGAGKSHFLAAVGDRVLAWPRTPGTLNVVVAFNAWRYEREEHLLIPLLKVAQQALEKALETSLLGDEFDEVRRKELWKDRIGLVSDLASSLDARGARSLLNMGFKLLGLPVSLPERSKPAEGGKAGDAAAAEPIWQELGRRRTQRRTERRTQLPMQALESLYFDFLEHLKAVTGRNPAYLKKHRERLAQGWMFKNEPSDLRVNLIFLVDDLDRCLPDKAVEVLEAIKLFLEVPGCAFVLALDEEVVERGIAHRYRDYALQGKAGLTPITGAEYLEKLVHLPIRLPRPSRLEARAHLAQRVPAWFRSEQNGLSNELAELVANLTPPVPRKLHRMAELLQLADGMLETESHRLGVDAGTRRRWLALVCALQLFAPALFRYLRVHGADLLMTLVEWRTSGELRDLDALRLKLTEARKKAERPEALAYQMKLERLPDLVEAALHNRSGFDLLEVLGRAARLREERQLEETALGAVFSFVLFAEEETPPEGWQPPEPPPEATKPEAQVETQPADADEVGPLVPRRSPHPKDYTLPSYARLENAFALAEAMRSSDVKVLRNALSIQGTNLLGRLVPDDMVAYWCDEQQQRGVSLSTLWREVLRILEPHLSQWAALRLGLTFGLEKTLTTLRRMAWALEWQEPRVSTGEAVLPVKVPGLAGPSEPHELQLALPLRAPAGDSPAEQSVRAWRLPMGTRSNLLKLEGAAPGVLGVDEYGLFADLSFNSVPQRFRYLPPGEFQMGSPDGEGNGDDPPRHLVTLTEGFWLADTPCTQALWLAVAGGGNPSKFQEDAQQPVEQVSWDDVMQQFMPKLQALLPAGCEATLPSEAQWEYACRAGTQTAYAWGNQPDDELANMAQKINKTTPVGTYPANSWGLFDMHGNVFEWCIDASRSYANQKAVSPPGAVGVRGGSWNFYAEYARSAFHLHGDRDRRLIYFGFRVALKFK